MMCLTVCVRRGNPAHTNARNSVARAPKPLPGMDRDMLNAAGVTNRSATNVARQAACAIHATALYKRMIRYRPFRSLSHITPQQLAEKAQRVATTSEIRMAVRRRAVGSKRPAETVIMGGSANAIKTAEHESMIAVLPPRSVSGGSVPSRTTK